MNQFFIYYHSSFSVIEWRKIRHVEFQMRLYLIYIYFKLLKLFFNLLPLPINFSYKFEEPGPIMPDESVAVDSVCKISTIRNVQLTTPNFHKSIDANG